MIITMTIIGLLVFCTLVSYACCVVSGKCSEREWREWIRRKDDDE